MKLDERAKKVEAGVRLAYRSLETHLPYTYGKPPKSVGNKSFHKRAVKEYIQLIKLLSELY